MTSRRCSQQGHASLPSVIFSTGTGQGRRMALGMGALAAAAAVTFLFASCVAPGSSRDARPGVRVEPATQPSLIDSAAARAHDAEPFLTGQTPSGLAAKPLSGDDLKQVLPLLGRAEARLIDIYQRIGQGLHREALAKAEALVRDHPNFHLAQLVLGDLLNLQTRPVRQLGDVPDTQAEAASEQLATLRDESRRRMRALTERPPGGHIPTQFLTLSPQSRHAIAIDASRSRLYLFENLSPARPETAANRSPRLRLLGDYYISVGLSGIDKAVEGDKRTPLGVYYITSNLNADNLPDLYGVGALPINYPNPLDLLRGKTGSGIWLHGTPREQFVRAPQASDGCMVLSNPDLERLLSTVQIRTTPVIIAPELHWVEPGAMNADRRQFEESLEAWRSLKSQGKLPQLKAVYSSRFVSQGRDLAQWWPKVEDEIRSAGQRELQLKELSLLRWRDSQDTMVVTFGEVAAGQTRGVTRRQYWMRESDQWKIFFEGTL